MSKTNKDQDKSNPIKITDDKGNVKRELEIVSDRENTAHPGTFIIEVKEVKK